MSALHRHRFTTRLWLRTPGSSVWACRCDKGDWDRYHREQKVAAGWMAFWELMHRSMSTTTREKAPHVR